jgi:hypothetical protein
MTFLVTVKMLNILSFMLFLQKFILKLFSKLPNFFDRAALTLAKDFLYKNVTLAVPALTALGDTTQIGPHCPR